MRPGRGRKPKPIELRILQGNPGKRAIPKDIPQADKLYNVPPPPEHLNDIAKERWNYLAPKLVKCGIVTELDVDTLEICCTALATIRMAAAKIKENTLVLIAKNDDGSVKSAHKTPYMNVWLNAIEVFDKYGAKLGLSPVDRIKLRGVEKQAESDPLQDFLNYGKTKAN